MDVFSGYHYAHILYEIRLPKKPFGALKRGRADGTGANDKLAWHKVRLPGTELWLFCFLGLIEGDGGPNERF